MCVLLFNNSENSALTREGHITKRLNIVKYIKILLKQIKSPSVQKTNGSIERTDIKEP